MATKQSQVDEKSKVSTVQLAVGAASLFLFIVGLKRTFSVQEARGTRGTEDGETKNGDGRSASGRTR
jgi:hypothetical protein